MSVGVVQTRKQSWLTQALSKNTLIVIILFCFSYSLCVFLPICFSRFNPIPHFTSFYPLTVIVIAGLGLFIVLYDLYYNTVDMFISGISAHLYNSFVLLFVFTVVFLFPNNYVTSHLVIRNRQTLPINSSDNNSCCPIIVS